MISNKKAYKEQILRKKMISVIVYGIMFLIATIAYYFVNTSNARNVEKIIVSVIDEEVKIDKVSYEIKVAEEDGQYFVKLPKTQNGFFVSGYKVVTEEEFRKIEKLYDGEEIDELEEKEKTEENEENKIKQDAEIKEDNKEEVKDNEDEETNNENNGETTNLDINQEENEENTNTDIDEDENKEIINNTNENEENEILNEGEDEEEATDDEENMIPPEENIIVNSEQLDEQKIFLIAKYDYKEVEDQILYNKKLSRKTEKNIINVLGYVPENAELFVSEVEKGEVENKINNNIEDVDKTISISTAYDIKIIVNEEEFEPEDLGENVTVYITGISGKELNIWHIKNDDTVEKMEYDENNQDISFETDEFSIYGVETLDEDDSSDEDIIDENIIINETKDVGKKEPRRAGVRATGDSVLEIDDYWSDYYYYMGKNYTDNLAGTNTNTYSDSNLVEVTLNYHGFAYGETDNDMKGRISLDETQDIVQNIRCVPVESGNISIELMENPFMDKPTGYGFAGWTAASGIISTDSKTFTQTLTLQTSVDVTIDLYANWATATVVYVNGATGSDNGLHDGLSEDEPFGSWSSAFNYLYSHNKNDRERNIIVVTGNVDCSINYTRPITKKVQRAATVTYNPSTNIITNEQILISSGNGAGGNAITADGSTVDNTVLATNAEPPTEAVWTIIASGNGYKIRNAANSNLYLSCSSNGTLSVSTTQTVWRLNNRRLYYSGSYYNYYLRWYSNRWQTTTTQSSGTQLYFIRFTSVPDPNGTDIVTYTQGSLESNSNYTNNRSVPVTITSLYNHTDYRETATISLTTADYDDFEIYKDFQMNHVKIYASGYKSNSGRNHL